MKLRLKDNAVVKYFKSNVIESYAGHIIPTKIVVDIPSNNYTLTLIQTDECIVGNGLVNWGDGEITNLNNIRSHVYKNAGKYTIEGQFIFVGNLHSSMQNTLIYIQYLSNKHNGRSFDDIFNNCTKLEHVSQKRCKIAPISMVNTFASSKNLKKTTYIESCWDLNSVTNMYSSFRDCYNLIGPIVAGPNVNNMSSTYAFCNNLTGSPVCGNNVTNMAYTYQCCYNLTGSPVCGNNVTNMAYTYQCCNNLTGSPVCGNKVTDMTYTYQSCYNLTGSPVCGNNVTNMRYAYQSCYNLTGSPVCGNKVTNMRYAYDYCTNLTGDPVCGPNVTDMSHAYSGCYNITGNPVCGNNVTNMVETYWCCNKLTGNPVCGNNVTNVSYAYFSCQNLTGDPVCGPNVTNMHNTYYNCINLTGKPVCGNSVVNMSTAYGFCTNLRGPALVGPNVTDIMSSYRSCRNITQNAYVFSNIVSNSKGCFQGKDNSKRLDIYVHKNSTTLNNFLNTDSTSLVGSNITWAQNGEMYYNTPYNIYIYPVDSVEEKYMENESGLIVTYMSTESHKDYDPYSIQGLTNGYTRTVVDLGNGQYRISLFTNDTNDIVTSLSFADRSCLTDIIKVTNDLETLNNTFMNCINLTGDPVCGPEVTNMRSAYRNCYNLTGSPVCGDKVTDMACTYLNCRNLTGIPVCGNNVTGMNLAYHNCHSLTGSPVCGDKVIRFDGAYASCRNLTGSPVCGNDVTNMTSSYISCHNLTGNPVCGPNVTYMESTYKNCYNIKGNAVCGDKVLLFNNAYHSCWNLNGNPACGNHAKYMSYTYYDCVNLTGNPVCGTNVTDMSYTYYNCYKITGSPVCGSRVTNMDSTYVNCYSLTGNPVCGDIVTNMYYTYNNCQRLSGNPVCGNNVTIMLGTYYNCRNLTGNPVCGPNVNRFDEAFWYCTNLTGDPVCGNNVTNMVNTYSDCYNLTGPAIIGTNVTNAVGAYLNCYNIGANAYIYANNCYVDKCFKGKYNDRRLNIYVHKNTNTMNRCLDTSNATSIIGKNVTWTQSGEMYYNTAYNVYIYPVDSVEDTYEEHKNKPVLVYNATSSDITPNTQGLESGYRINSSVINEGTITPTPTQLIITADQHNAENPPSTSTIVPDFNVNSFKISNERIFNTNSTNGNARVGIDYYYEIQIQLDHNRINDYKLLYKNVLYSIAYVENDTWHYYELPDDIYNSFYIMSYTDDIGYFVYLSQNDGSDGLTDDLYLIDTGSDRLVKNKIIKKSDEDSLTAFNFTDINDSIGIRHIEYIDDSVVNMSNAFRRSMITGNILCGNNVQDMSDCYAYCLNISCNPVCGDKVTNMTNAYCYCTNLTGSPVCGPNVVNMSGAYANCHKLTGNPVCGNNVKDMSSAYCNCTNLTGNPVCGPNVTDMESAYGECYNLTGSPVCGPNVTDMSHAYSGCYNITGNPVCGDKVTNMYQTYYYCNKLTGNPVCGPNVTNMCQTYQGAVNCHYGNMIMYSNNVGNMYKCFSNKSSSRRLNIYVQRSSTSLNSCLVNNTKSMVGSNITWTNAVSSSGYYYNTSRNIYIYPVDDISAIGNEVLMYSAKSAHVRPTTEGLTSGYSAKTATIKASTVTTTPTQLIVSQAQHSSGNIPEYSTIVNSVNETIDEVGIMNTEENGITPRLGVSGIYEVILQSIDRNRVGDYKLYVNGVLYNSSTDDNKYFEFHLTGDYEWYNFTISLYHSDKVVFYYDYDQMSWSTYDLPGDLYLVDCGDNGDYDLTISKKKKNETMNAFKFEDLNSKATITDITYISDDVTNMSGAFHGCAELACNPLCGDSVINMSNAYNSCSKLIGSAACGPNVTDMCGSYYSCTNLTSAVCGNKVINMSNAYYACYNLTGSPACGPNVTNMSNAYYDCLKLTGSPVCGNNVKDMSNAYGWCRNLTGSPVCGPNVTNMAYTYANCHNISGNVACGPNVVNMDRAYFQSKGNIKNPSCGDKVTSMVEAYEYCTNLTGSPACGPNVVNMCSAYYSCYNLTGSPVCGNNVRNMRYTYDDCEKLTGKPVCGPNVTDMSHAYSGCYNITGNPVCGPNVVDMVSTYWYCNKLTGNPVCSNKVSNMREAYYYCTSLTGNPVCGPNVTDMAFTYEGAINCHYGNMIMYSNNVGNMYKCFNNKSSSRRLNIYVQKNSTSLNSCLVTNNRSMVGANITWTNAVSSSGYYYNTSRNIYIYPVNNVYNI